MNIQFSMSKLLIVAFLLLFAKIFSQTESAEVLAINFQIDEGVVQKDVGKLEKLYGDDFVFTHGTGLVDGKGEWLKAIQNPEVYFRSRKQDSTKAEMHGSVAILTGKVDIIREQKQVVSKYGIWYVRVFVKRKGSWQLISHRTTKEWHN